MYAANRCFDGQDTAEDIAAAAFAIGHNSRPDGDAAGRIVLNSLSIVDNVDKHPATDRLPMNVIAYAARHATGPPVATPCGF